VAIAAALGLGRGENDLVARRGSEDDSRDRRRPWTDVNRRLVVAEPSLDAVGGSPLTRISATLNLPVASTVLARPGCRAQ